MIFGVGADIMKANRLDGSLSFDDPFVRKTFTAGEIEESRRKKDPSRYFTTRFACKEAIFKCLKMDGNHVRLNQIEVLNSDIGYPTVKLLYDLKKYADERGITTIELSLSHEEDYIVAYAIAQKTNF